MRKSIHDPEYRKLLRLMREWREKAGLSQEEVADRLGLSQSQLSKWERGERRIDVLELHRYCLAIGIRLDTAINQWQKQLKG